VITGSEAYTCDEFCKFKENNMKKLMTICFALVLLTFGVIDHLKT
jgi:hypothetical protein